MAWIVWACDTTTGAKLGQLPAASFSWQRVLNSGGGGSATFKLADPAFREIDMRSWTKLVNRTLVIEWTDTPGDESAGEPVFAGVVWSRKWDKDSATLSVTYEDIWSILKRRFLVSQNTTGVAQAAPIAFTNISVSTAVKKTVQAGTGDLPMVYWGDFTGSRSVTYQSYLLKTVADAIKEQISQPDGPDLDFRPIWGPGGLQYQMRSNQQFGTYSWNMSANQSGVTGVTVDEDGTKLSNNVFSVGQGTEADTLIRASPATSPYPLLQSSEAHKSETDLAKLDGYVTEAQRVHATPTEQWGFDMLAGGGNGDANDQTKVTDLRLNGVLSLYTQGDYWIPDGTYQHRLIQYSGDLGPKVTLEFQPTGGA